jgi:hypothetical protein
VITDLGGIHLAFEEGFGTDPSQQRDEDYALSAYDIMSTTLKLWYRKLIHYILITGVVGALSIGVSFVLIFLFFGTLGTISADPFSYLINFLFEPTIDIQLFVVTITLAFFTFILTVITLGAAIKFTLDEYGGPSGDIGASFRHSLDRVVPVIIVQLILSFFSAIILTPAMSFLNQAMDMIDLTDISMPIIPPAAIELMMIGMVLFAIGGLFLIYINVRFAPVLAIVIDTDLSAVDSLKRSWELTSNNFLHIFGSYILLSVALLIIEIALTFVLELALLPVDTLLVINTILTALLFSSLSYIFTAVLYRDLESRHGDRVDSSLPGFIG